MGDAVSESRVAPSVVVERRGPAVVVRLDRPGRLNAIDRAMVRELDRAVQALSEDPSVAAVVFTGEGRAFSAGADIAEISQLDGPPEFLSFSREIQAALDRIDDLPKPTIAALNGVAFGSGRELPLACDLRVMADDASLGVPEIKIGVLPAAGGTQRLTRLVPQAVAKQMLLFGDPLPAADALRLGLVNELVAAPNVVDTAVAWAERLADRPPLALRPRRSSCAPPVTTCAPGCEPSSRPWRCCSAPRTPGRGCRRSWTSDRLASGADEATGAYGGRPMARVCPSTSRRPKEYGAVISVWVVGQR